MNKAKKIAYMWAAVMIAWICVFDIIGYFKISGEEYIFSICVMSFIILLLWSVLQDEDIGGRKP